MTGFGLGVLRLPPEAFWRATPAEIAAAARGMAGPRAPAMRRGELDRLMARFPDHAETKHG
ncbi:phage tail assembly chaperone [Hansschlegelia zhihuaiae]|uniref:Phage tail assembly chaperone n=1 Tax=Hansschlegelia zhihuaiae TaxID=405005 RepID=A0A4Q0MNI8_9HYPH|nr:phage tail assembly chaperone [Hansschlegelia zhihuaiae]RXF75451.1 phage tail assembly chaperone [Hansschlegelia zhihuaiae]